jgi:hypothetical protein
MRRCRLTWEDAAVTVGAFDAALVDRAARLLDLSPEDDGTEGLGPPDLGVRRQGRRFVVETPGQAYEIDGESDLIVSFVTLMSASLLRKSRRTILHAGAFIVDGEAVLYSGAQRAGKSALSLTAWRLGYPVLGDDCIVVEGPTPRARPFPKPMQPRLRSPELAPALWGAPACDHAVGRLCDEQEYRLLMGRRLPNVVAYGTTLPVRRLFLIERGARTAVLPAERHETLRFLIGQVIQPRPQPLRILGFLEPLWRAGGVCRLMVGEDDLHGAVSVMAAEPRSLETAARSSSPDMFVSTLVSQGCRQRGVLTRDAVAPQD